MARPNPSDVRQVCQFCPAILASPQEVEDRICSTCLIDPMCPVCDRRDSAHDHEPDGLPVCCDAAILAKHPMAPAHVRAKLARGEQIAAGDFFS